jgi:hypothetical protein
MKQPTHLGDGAYASEPYAGAALLTANHHDPMIASDRVELDPQGVEAFCRWYFGETIWQKMKEAAR